VTELVGIGEVIRQLRGEFPDLTVSKVRFLEAQGLVHPHRTASGYRKFSSADVARLRYALRAQRDHFLPLKVIGEHLDAMERGLQPPSLQDPSPRPPTDSDALLHGDLKVTATELRRESGLDAQQLTAAQEQGLLASDGQGMFPASDIEAAKAIVELAKYGLTARHLRAARLAADRIAGIVDQSAQSTEQDPNRRATAAIAVSEAAGRLNAALLARYVDERYRNVGA
jgi:DNA-binding transcriptional MerR regulator